MTDTIINTENGKNAENNSNVLHFKRLGSSHDVNSRGAIWYEQNLNDNADYPLLFSYLSNHLEEHLTGMRPHLADLLRAQVAFQKLYSELKEIGTHSDGSLVVTDDGLEKLTIICKTLDVYKRKFGGSSQLGKTAAGKVLLDLSREAKKQSAQNDVA